MSRALVDSRPRASQLMIGTSWPIVSASRTSCVVYGWTPSKQFRPTTYGSPRCSKKSTAAKQSARRRVSTRTTAPMAPRTSSSHMNQNRVCPGVPNRYRIKSSSSVIRPKSIATVVVDLPGIFEASSTSIAAAVITASVVSGRISDTEPTSVVLPTPNPPAMTILAEVARLAVTRGGRPGLELPKSTEHPFQQIRSELVVEPAGLVHVQHSGLGHVADDYSGNPERCAEIRRDFRQRLHLLAELDDPLPLVPGRSGLTVTACGGRDQCLHRDVDPG